MRTFLYVTPTGGSTTASLKTTFAAAKAAPVTLTAAITAVTPGLVVVLADGVYNQQIRLEAGQSGTEAEPIYFVSENKLGAKIVGPTAGSERSAITTWDCHDVQFHNLDVEVTAGNAGDWAAFKIHKYSTTEIFDNRIVIAGCHIHGSGRDLIKVSGQAKVTIEGNNFVAVDLPDSIIDYNASQICTTRFNTMRGNCQTALAIKGYAYAHQVNHNDIRVQQKTLGASYTPAIFLGHDGSSDANATWRMHNYPFRYAGAWQADVYKNVLSTSWSRAVSFKGALLCNVHDNVLQNSGSGNIVESIDVNYSAYTGMPAITAADAPYVTIASGIATIKARSNTMVRNAVLTGSSKNMQSQFPATDYFEALTTVSDADAFIGEPYGIAGFNSDAVYVTTGIVPPPVVYNNYGTFRFIDTTTQTVIADVVEGDVFDYTFIGRPDISVEFVQGDYPLKNVLMEFPSTGWTQWQGLAPYALYNDVGGVFTPPPAPMFPTAGAYTLKAGVYPDFQQGGTPVAIVEVAFSIAEQPVTIESLLAQVAALEAERAALLQHISSLTSALESANTSRDAAVAQLQALQTEYTTKWNALLAKIAAIEGLTAEIKAL